MKFPVGTLLRFNQDYFKDSPELLEYLGIVLPPQKPEESIRILWESCEIEECREEFSYYFEEAQ